MTNDKADIRDFQPMTEPGNHDHIRFTDKSMLLPPCIAACGIRLLTGKQYQEKATDLMDFISVLKWS